MLSRMFLPYWWGPAKVHTLHWPRPGRHSLGILGARGPVLEGNLSGFQWLRRPRGHGALASLR